MQFLNLDPILEMCSFSRVRSFSLCPTDTVEESLRVEREREEWEREQAGPGVPRRVAPRSVSRERWVETLVVADSKLIEYHGSDNVESYIFTIMNMVRKEAPTD